MKFKLDENLPRAAADVLRTAGHDALMVPDQIDPGADDATVAELARGEERVLVTLDLDFGDIRTYRPSEYSGIVVLRPRHTDAVSVLSLVERVAVAMESESPGGSLWVVGEDRIRIRRDSS